MPTNGLGELCKVVLRDNYGELAEIVVTMLLNHGRQSASQIAKLSGIPVPTVHRVLVALIQNRFVLYWTDDAESKNQSFYYTVHWNNVYAVLWTGQILQVVADSLPDHGRAAEITKNMLVYGHMKTEDYINAYPELDRTEVTRTLTTLVSKRFLVPVMDFDFNPIDDIYAKLLGESLDKLRTSTQSETAKMATAKAEADKRKSEILAPKDDPNAGLINLDGSEQAKQVYGNGNGLRNGFDKPVKKTIDKEAILTVDPDHFLVIARNDYLASVAKRRVGTVSGQVYRAVLRCYESRIRRCKSEGDQEPSYISSRDVALNLDKDVTVGGAFVSAERRRPAANGSAGGAAKRRRTGIDTSIDLNGGNLGAEDDDDDDEDDDEDEHDDGYQNGSNTGQADEVSMHLKLLADSPDSFLIQGPGNKGWYVPFNEVIDTVKRLAYDEYITGKYGRVAARILRVVRDKGKVDEKLLSKLALLQMDDLRSQAAKLQEIGCLDLQEIPRGNDRTPARSFFLWFHKPQHAYANLVQDLYITMKNLYLRLMAERNAHSVLLAKIERVDVKGNEDEFLSELEKKEINELRRREEKILTQVWRLDELVKAFEYY